MGKSWLVAVAACAVLIAGCTPTSSDNPTSSVADPTSATQQTPSQVSVPATRLDTDVDQTYELKDTASVINDVWADGTFGKVSVMARRGVSQSNRTPLLMGTLNLADGTTLQLQAVPRHNLEQFRPVRSVGPALRARSRPLDGAERRRDQRAWGSRTVTSAPTWIAVRACGSIQGLAAGIRTGGFCRKP